jgi:hypothetical protein
MGCVNGWRDSENKKEDQKKTRHGGSCPLGEVTKDDTKIWRLSNYKNKDAGNTKIIWQEGKFQRKKFNCLHSLTV